MIRLALPTGDVRGETAALLKEAGLEVSGYAAGSRAYRLRTEGREQVRVRLFRQKDIPIQIALGNYDLGICSLAWVEELLRRYPSEAIVRVCDLGIDRGGLYLAAADGGQALAGSGRGLRIVSEYANLAEALAVRLRLPAYRVLPVWGAAEAYPPEDAELALLAAPDEEAVRTWGLRPLQQVLETSAWLVANRDSLAHRDLTPVLGRLLAHHPMVGEPQFCLPRRLPAEVSRAASALAERGSVRLALPDGHQQPQAVAALTAAGLHFPGYEEDRAVRRPTSTMEGLEVKVIRPQDMPQQVALGSFDLAITGRDWLLDHLRRFPSSPVEEVADLGRGRFAIVATVYQDLPATTVGEAVAQWRAQGRKAIRVASEYTNVADHYARWRHLGHYQVIPVSGASEGFVPEDAELLIEGMETGRSLAANRLKPIERLFESTTCLIAARRPLEGRRRKLVEGLVSRLREAGAGAPTGPREG